MNKATSESFYQQIADLLDSFVPVDWETIYLYCEVVPDSVLTYYSFVETGTGRYFDIDNAPSELNLDSNAETMFIVGLNQLVGSLRAAMVAEGDAPWSVITYIFHSVGKLRVEFGYDDVLHGDPLVRRSAWKSKYLV